MTSIFEGQPRKQGLFQSKQGSFGFQVYMHQVLQYDTTTSITLIPGTEGSHDANDCHLFHLSRLADWSMIFPYNPTKKKGFLWNRCSRLLLSLHQNFDVF